MDGALAPLVYPMVASSAPAASEAAAAGGGDPFPAAPTLYRVAGAPRVALGECATLGTSRSLKRVGGGAGGAQAAAVEGQPSIARGAGLPSAPVCGPLTTGYKLTFGPFDADACGSYLFTSDLSAKPFNTSQVVREPLNFNVDVTGCS